MTELLEDIRIKDRRYRVARTVFMILTVGALSAIIVFEAVILSKVQAQLTQQRRTVEELKQNTSEQLGKQTKYILCIAKFFTIPNRQNTTLSLDDCFVSTPASNNASPTASTPPSPPAAQTQATGSSTPATQSNSDNSSNQVQRNTFQRAVDGVVKQVNGAIKLVL